VLDQGLQCWLSVTKDTGSSLANHSKWSYFFLGGGALFYDLRRYG